jgi:hypothetical protein
LSGSGQVIDSGAAATLFLNGGNFSGVISSPLSVTVLGGSATLSGNNTYTGATTINSGTSLTLGGGGTSRSHCRHRIPPFARCFGSKDPQR